MVKKITDLSSDDKALLVGAKEVLDERFGRTKWCIRLVPGFLGLSNFTGVLNHRPGSCPPLSGKAGNSSLQVAKRSAQPYKNDAEP